MTNAELLAKIKAEIERRKKSLRAGICNEEVFTRKQRKEMLVASEELDRLNRCLSTLESEKPMNQEGIDTEIGHWMDRLDDKYCLLVPHYSIQDIKDTARHFAQWGAEHSGSSEIPKDLDQAAEISFDEAYALTGDYTNFLAKGLTENQPRPIGPHWFCEYAKKRFIAGAKWDRSQMMREAVEGTIVYDHEGGYATIKPNWLVGNIGDKVRVIILKE